MKKTLYVFGAGGFGREVMPIVQDRFPAYLGYEHIFMVDASLLIASCGNGLRLSTITEFIEDPYASYAIAVGSPKDRSEIHRRLMTHPHAQPFSIESKHTVMMQPHIIGPGSIICAFASIHPNVFIGKQFHANIYSYVAHDCRVGDYVTLAPKAAINGGCVIGDGAYIGTGAILREKITVGEGAVVGAGAVVVKDVLPWTTVVGNPARVMQ